NPLGWWMRPDAKLNVSGSIRSLPLGVSYQPSASRTTSIWFGADPSSQLLGYFHSSAARTYTFLIAALEKFTQSRYNLCHEESFDLSRDLSTLGCRGWSAASRCDLRRER